MISAIITRGIGFGDVNYIPTHGFISSIPPVVEPGIVTTAITAHGCSVAITSFGSSVSITSHGASTAITGDN